MKNKKIESNNPNLTKGGGADNANFTFLHEKLPHFVVYFIQNNTKLTPPQTLGHYSQMPSIYNLTFSKRNWKTVTKKFYQLPFPGMIVFF